MNPLLPDWDLPKILILVTLICQIVAIPIILLVVPRQFQKPLHPLQRPSTHQTRRRPRCSPIRCSGLHILRLRKSYWLAEVVGWSRSSCCPSCNRSLDAGGRKPNHNILGSTPTRSLRRWTMSGWNFKKSLILAVNIIKIFKGIVILTVFIFEASCKTSSNIVTVTRFQLP